MEHGVFLPLLSGLSSFLKALQLVPDFNSTTGIFCFIAWLATLMGLILFVISLFCDIGGDADVAGDADVSGDGADSGIFSFRAMVGFLLGFGWLGFACSQQGCSLAVSVLAGLGAGILMFFLVAGMIRFVYSLKCDGSLRYESLVGMEGTVYVSLPPRGGTGGQVQISHPSQLITMAAVQDGERELPVQTRVRVLKASSSLLTVEEVK